MLIAGGRDTAKPAANGKLQAGENGAQASVVAALVPRKSVCMRVTGLTARLCRDEPAPHGAPDGQKDAWWGEACNSGAYAAPEITAQCICVNLVTELRPEDVSRGGARDHARGSKAGAAGERGIKADVLGREHEFRWVWVWCCVGPCLCVTMCASRVAVLMCKGVGAQTCAWAHTAQ